MRPGDRDKVFEVNVGGTRNVMEEALRAGVVRVVHTSSAGAVGPAEPHGTAERRRVRHRGDLADLPPVVNQRGAGRRRRPGEHEPAEPAVHVPARGLIHMLALHDIAHRERWSDDPRAGDLYR